MEMDTSLKRKKTFLTRVLPFLYWIPGVTKSTARSDFLAGLTNAVIVLPQGVAFAMIAGLPPEYGLYTAIVPPIVAGLFGSSFHLISGPTTAISIVVFSTISPYAQEGSAQFVSLALTLTFLAGLIQFGFGAARLGSLINFVSHSVVVGFTAGAAILIASSQIKHCLGIPVPSGESFLHTWIDLASMVSEVNVHVLLVAVSTLASAVLFRIYKPRWPGMLLGMVVGSLVALVIGSEEHGIALVGPLPSSLPPFSVPDFSSSALTRMASGALAVSMLGLVEAVSIARSIAIKSKQRIDGNQEFIGQGLANLVGSFFSCYASSGSFTRSGVNFTAGAKTPLAGVFAALLLAAILLLVAPLAAYLPIPTLGGIILLVAYNLIDFHQIKSILKTSSQDFSVLITTFLATLLVELEFAIYVGVILSLVLYLNKTSKPRVVGRVPDPAKPNRSFTTDPALPECPQLKIVRIDGSLYFGSINHVEESIQYFFSKEPDRRNLLIVCSGINFIDISGAEMLSNLVQRLREKGGDLYLYRLKDSVAAFLGRGSYLEQIGKENIFSSKTAAIRTIFQKLVPEVCRRCDKRIFLECRDVPVLLKRDGERQDGPQEGETADGTPAVPES
jgi:SulP family sulfate permease